MTDILWLIIEFAISVSCVISCMCIKEKKVLPVTIFSDLNFTHVAYESFYWTSRDKLIFVEMYFRCVICSTVVMSNHALLE